MSQHHHDHHHDHHHGHQGHHDHAHTAHSHAGSAHSHAHGTVRTLAWALALTLGFAVVEVAGSFFSNSLALFSDAGHMMTDGVALGLALLAQWMARRPPSSQHSYGYARAEALAAFVNGLLMLAVVAWIAVQAISRLLHPEAVQGLAVSIVAALGLAVNVLVAWLLMRGEGNLNTRAALVHVMGDLLGSVAALTAGLVVWLTGWMVIDPLLSLLVSLLILKSTWGVLRDAYHLLMEGVPRHVDYVALHKSMQGVAGVQALHDLHVWEMSSQRPALTGHVVLADLADWPSVLGQLTALLHQSYGIDHVTLQPELASMPCHAQGCTGEIASTV